MKATPALRILVTWLAPSILLGGCFTRFMRQGAVGEDGAIFRSEDIWSIFEISNRKQGVIDGRGGRGEIESWRTDTSPRGGSRAPIIFSGVLTPLFKSFSLQSGNLRMPFDSIVISRSKIRAPGQANLNGLCRHSKLDMHWQYILHCCPGDGIQAAIIMMIYGCLIWIWKFTYYWHLFFPPIYTSTIRSRLIYVPRWKLRSGSNREQARIGAKFKKNWFKMALKG